MRPGRRAISRPRRLNSAPSGARCQRREGQNRRGPTSVMTAGMRVRLAASMTATEMARPGAIACRKPRSASSMARKAKITTRAEEATASPTRRTL